MTPQKALEILEMFLHKQCDLQRTEFAYSQKEVYMAVSMAQHALEKPIQETTEQSKSLTLVFGKDGKARLLNEDYVIYCADKETFEKVKEAVEKQKPKKVDVQTEDDREFIDYVCPYCKTTLQQKMKIAKRTTIHKSKHCDECGQALDWSDTE